MKKLFIALCLFPLLSSAQTLNIIKTDVDSFRVHLSSIAAILGGALNEHKRQDETYPLIFGDIATGTFIKVDFANPDYNGGKSLVENILISGSADKVDSVHAYFKSIAKKNSTYTETSAAVWWGKVRMYISDNGKQGKMIRLLSR